MFFTLQILIQHIKAILPGLKSRISSALVSVAKEHASYGEITESKARKICYVKDTCKLNRKENGMCFIRLIQDFFIKYFQQ